MLDQTGAQRMGHSDGVGERETIKSGVILAWFNLGLQSHRQSTAN
jgi:hypothetical protein